MELADTLTETLGAADVPAGRDAAVAKAIEIRPDLAAELARGNAARTAASAISAERLPRLAVAADYGLGGNQASDAVSTRGLSVQLSWPFWTACVAKGARPSNRPSRAAFVLSLPLLLLMHRTKGLTSGGAAAH